MKQAANGHPTVWLCWLGITAVCLTLARNPLYTLLILLVILLVRQRAPQTNAPSLPLWRLAITIMLFSGGFNLLFVHQGDTILGRLPQSWPLIGGNLTLESVIFGMSNGLILFTLLLLFSTFNQLVAPSQLVHILPTGLREVGVVLLIALTYVPETTRHLQRIREAQAVRGHTLSGLRDWPPLVVPLLVGGLERALNLAETMVARGYGGNGRLPTNNFRVAIFSGLLALLVGWVLLVMGNVFGWVLLLGGAILLVWLVRWWGGRVKRSRYRPLAFTNQDVGFVLLMLIPLGLLIVWRSQIGYTPYPAASVPPFNVIVGVGLVLLTSYGLVRLA